jgi:hypothetical protein
MAARLSPVCNNNNNKRRPVAFRPVFADRFGFSVFRLGSQYSTVIQFVKFFFGVDTSGAIALLKFPKAHQQTIKPGFPATIIHSGFFRLWWRNRALEILTCKIHSRS